VACSKVFEDRDIPVQAIIDVAEESIRQYKATHVKYPPSWSRINNNQLDNQQTSKWNIPGEGSSK
jgi:hypothetical protein